MPGFMSKLHVSTAGLVTAALMSLTACGGSTSNTPVSPEGSSSTMSPTQGPPDPHGTDPIPTNPPAPNTPTNPPDA